MKLALTFSLLSLLAAAPAQADVSVQSAWARATASASAMGAVYLSITSSSPDKLTAVSTPVAANAAVHESYRNGNTVGMRPVDSLAVSPNKPTVLAPGGYHSMLMGLKKKLVKGSTFPVTLTFEKAGKVETTVHIEAAGASGPAAEAGGSDMDHMKMDDLPGMKH